MKCKRGQVTIFIIVAILIIGGVALFFTLKGTLQREEVSTPEVASVKNFVEECIEDVGEEGIFIVSMQGGFLNPEPNILIKEFRIGYLYYEGENKLPSLKNIENEISSYVTNKLENCTDNFKSFKEMGFNIEQGEIKTNTVIKEDFVDITVKFPLSVEKAGSKSNLQEEYKKTYPIRLKKYYDVAKNIVEMEIENPLTIDAIFLLDQNISVDFTNYGNKIIVYALEDEESKINDKQYLFVFANKLK